MKYILLLMSFLLTSSYSLAQGRIEYEYDEVGNRICQSCVMPVQNKAMAKSKFLVDEKLSDRQQNISVDVYPNPTSDYIHIIVKGIVEHGNYSLTLCTSQGTMIFSKSVTDEMTDINLTDYPNGVYLLAVGTESNKTICKVVKQ